MNKPLTCAIFASDKRYYNVAVLLSRDDYKCNILTPDKSEICEAVKNANVVILPIPSFDENDMLFGKIKADKLFDCLSSGTFVFAGKVSPMISRLANEYNLRLFDYSARDEFSIMNAVPTAEGAIVTAIEALGTTIAAGKFTVLGYGKVGRALAPRLKALGGDVTVAARNVIARANAESDGMKAMTMDKFLDKPPESTAIFNTVPSPIIDDLLAYKLKNTYFIDLASKPGGVYASAKNILGTHFIHALSLPGKYFPDTAGEIIYKTIIGILRGEAK